MATELTPNEGKKGVTVINGVSYQRLPIKTHLITMEDDIIDVAEKYDINVNLYGGGYTGQSQALRLAIARALVKINAEDKKALRAEGFMTRDSREVERKKPGRPKARRRFQFSKR